MAPIVLEIIMVSIVLITQKLWVMALITSFTMFIYFTITIVITEWRTKFRKKINDLDRFVFL